MARTAATTGADVAALGPSTATPMRSRRSPGPRTSPIGGRSVLRWWCSAAARNAAVSRTVLVTTPLTEIRMGRWSILAICRWRSTVGLKPTKPLMAAGMRIDPPPSVAWANGTTPAATSAPAPPDDPPADIAGSHGLRVGSPNSGSVVGANPNSEVAVLPRLTNPVAKSCSTSRPVVVGTCPVIAREP